MVKYDVLLCSNVFFACFIIPEFGFGTSIDNLKMCSIIKNHRLVLSDGLLRFYQSYAKENNYMTPFESFKLWYADQAVKDSFHEKTYYLFDEENEQDDIDVLFTDTTKRKDLNNLIIICGYCSPKKSIALSQSVNTVPVEISTNILTENIENRLLRNIMPFTVKTQRGDSVSSYIEWFDEMLLGQKKIIIFDRYAYATEEFKMMVKYIIERVSHDSEIMIYFDNQAAQVKECYFVERNMLLKRIATEKNCTIQTYDYNHHNNGGNRNSFHDRRIFFSQDSISLSAGFKCLCPANDLRTLQDGNYVITHNECNTREEVSSILFEHPGYSIFWDNTKSPDDFSVYE